MSDSYHDPAEDRLLSTDFPNITKCKIKNCWHEVDKDNLCTFHLKKLGKKTIGDIYG
jgi:hypothetical protein